jgi:hypothetical protein
MIEVFQNGETQLPLWTEAALGRPDFEALFAGYQAMVDYPGCKLWRELADYWPDAKVLHSSRDPDQWFESTQATILAPQGGVNRPPPAMKTFMDWVKSDFGDRIHDRAFMTDYFRAHDEKVRAAIAPERLLIYRAGDGWGPLCAFLGVPVPSGDYPNVNSREQFIGRVQAMAQQAQSSS